MPERRKGERRVYERRDIFIRDNEIIRLYMRGISRKEIACRIEWRPMMTYGAVSKVIQRFLTLKSF